MDKAALVLIIIAAINWGTYSIFGFNFVTAFVGDILARFVYVIMALAGLWCIKMLFREEDDEDERIIHHG